MKFAAECQHVANHFIMATSVKPEVAVEPNILAIPPTWRFPPTFTFMFMKKSGVEEMKRKSLVEAEGDDDLLPRVRMAGPANRIPLYMPVEGKSDVKGEGHMMPLGTSPLPQQAIDLMVHRPIETLARIVPFGCQSRATTRKTRF
jgi:hypothetical protein